MIWGEMILLELWRCYVLLIEVIYMYIERVNCKIIKKKLGLYIVIIWYKYIYM